MMRTASAGSMKLMKAYPTESNVGYAFINFIDPADAVRALQVFGEYRFQR